MTHKIQQGFSLIEVLATVVIIAIATTLALPSLTYHWQASTAKNLQNELEQAIHIAQAAAYNSGEQTYLCPSADTKICSNNWSQGFIVASHQHVLFIFQNLSATGELHWRSFPKNRAQIDFAPQSNFTEQNGTFWYCDSFSKNPAWAFTLNKIAHVREIPADRLGKFFDDKGKRISCDDL